MSGELDAATAKLGFAEVVGSLFMHRFVMCGVGDPCGYGLMSDYPDSDMHAKLSAVGQVLGKVAHCAPFGSEARYMQQFNGLIGERGEWMRELAEELADGRLLGKLRSEHAHVPSRLHKQSLCVYERMLEESGIDG